MMGTENYEVCGRISSRRRASFSKRYHTTHQLSTTYSSLIKPLNGLNIVLSTSQCIIDASDDQHTSEHEARPVHVLQFRWYSDWKERSDSRYNNVQHRKRIDWDRSFTKGEASRRKRLASQTLEEDAGDAERVAERCGAGEEGDDGVESGGGADVDEGDDDEDGQRE